MTDLGSAQLLAELEPTVAENLNRHLGHRRRVDAP